MIGLRRTLANLLFVFVGLPVTLSALFLISVRPWALDRETYKRFVQDDRLYAAIQAPEIAARAPAEIELRPASSGSAASVTLDGRALVAAAQKDLPWPAIKTAASGAVDAAFDAMGSAGGQLSLSMKALKSSFKQSLPALSRDYVAAAKGSAALPAGATDRMTALLGSYVDAVPDVLRADSPPTPAFPGRGERIPIGVISRAGGLSQAILNRMTATTAALSALLLTGLGALGGTGLLSRLSRAGRYLLFPSVLVLGLGAALAIPGGLILQNLLPEGAREMLIGPAGALLRSYLASALGPIAQTFFISGLVGVSVGGVLASARRFAAMRELDEPEGGNAPKELE